MSNKEICEAVLNSNLPNDVKIIIVQKFTVDETEQEMVLVW